MKAVAKMRREPGIEVIDSPQSRIEDSEVLVRMRSASICGSDLGFYNFTPAYEKWARVPVIMGHEFAGEVAGVGSKVSEFAEGDRVAAESVIYCGACRYCKSGMTNICRNFTVFGMHRNGGFAEYVAVDQKLLHKLPSGVSFLEAGVVEPLSVAVNAVDDVAEAELGMRAAVLGPGPLGLFSAEVLRSKGLTDIIVAGIGIDSFRLSIAKDRLGYAVLNSEEDDLNKIASERTEGCGYDIVVVAAGAASALSSAVSIAAKGGQVIVLGIFPQEVTFAASDIVRKQVSLRGSYASNWKHYEKAISLLSSKKVRAHDIVSHRFPLERAEEAFKMAMEKTACKVQFEN